MNAQTGKLDYLIIGHVTRDLLGGEAALGGTATYAGICAKNLGYETAILTSCDANLQLSELKGIRITKKTAARTTTFENIETPKGRKQMLNDVADSITAADVPADHRSAAIVHLGPVADEIHYDVIECFKDAFIALTPQGWMRQRDAANHVQYKQWEQSDKLLPRADAVVLSMEDVCGDQSVIDDFATKTKVLVVTEGYNGANVYWNGDVRHFSAPKVQVVDPTGAGDIFAAVFFTTLYSSKDPWESARRAVAIASDSVTRVGIKGVPTPMEMRALQLEIIEGK